MTSPLDYAPRPPWHKSRRLRRATICLLSLLALGGAAWYFGPTVYDRCTFLYWQHRCMVHTEPPGSIAMDAPAFSPGKTAATSTGLPPESLDESMFLKLGGWQFTDELVDCHSAYLHRIPTATGDCLISVTAHADSEGVRIDDTRSAGIQACLFSAGGINTKPQYLFQHGLSLTLQPADSLRVYSGQPDPADRASFTIDFDLNSVRHTARFTVSPKGDSITTTITPPLPE